MLFEVVLNVHVMISSSDVFSAGDSAKSALNLALERGDIVVEPAKTRVISSQKTF